ncbi:MAG TPA: hypothetical protein VGD35_23890, partial [Chitinophaga sp.]
MQEQQPSIFDQDFLQETYIRRRQLMPLALKILVWFFLVTSVYGTVNTLYSFFEYMLPSLSGIDNIIVLTTFFTGMFFSLVNILSSLFILLEKKWAILFALIVTLISLLSWSYSIYKLLSARFGDPTVTVLTAVFITSLKIPYIIMLLRIKRD